MRDSYQKPLGFSLSTVKDISEAQVLYLTSINHVLSPIGCHVQAYSLFCQKEIGEETRGGEGTGRVKGILHLIGFDKNGAWGENGK